MHTSHDICKPKHKIHIKFAESRSGRLTWEGHTKTTNLKRQRMYRRTFVSRLAKGFHKIVLVSHGSCWMCTGLDKLNLSIAAFAVFYPKAVVRPSLGCLQLKTI
jgi:hypothetical protein